MYLTRRLATLRLNQSPQRNKRPDTLEQQEAPLSRFPREHSKDGGSDEIESQVCARVLVKCAELGSGVRGKNEQRAGDLNDLIHRASVASRSSRRFRSRRGIVA